MTIGRREVVGLVVLAGLVAGLPALGVTARAATTVKPGSYSGKTEEDEAIRFKINGGRVRKLYFKWTATCDGGDPASTKVLSGHYQPPSFSAHLGSSGRFSFSRKRSDGTNLQITGVVRGSRAHGRLRLRFAYMGSGCDTDRIRWSAKHR